jgi:hypothetical protein
MNISPTNRSRRGAGGARPNAHEKGGSADREPDPATGGRDEVDDENNPEPPVDETDDGI